MHPPKFDKTVWAPAVGVSHSMCRFSEKPEDLGQRRQHLGILQVWEWHGLPAPWNPVTRAGRHLLTPLWVKQRKERLPSLPPLRVPSLSWPISFQRGSITQPELTLLASICIEDLQEDRWSSYWEMKSARHLTDHMCWEQGFCVWWARHWPLGLPSSSSLITKNGYEGPGTLLALLLPGLRGLICSLEWATGSRMWTWSHPAWTWIPALSCSGCVTSGKLLNHSGLRFLICQLRIRTGPASWGCCTEHIKLSMNAFITG